MRIANETQKITSITDIRQFFAENEVPLYFFSASPFNLLGINEWVKKFNYIMLLDCFDGKLPQCKVPKQYTPQSFDSIESICNYLLQHKDIVDQLRSARESNCKKSGAFFLFFNEETERICSELELPIYFPNVSMLKEMDSKIVTTEIGNAANVPSVPNILEKIDSFDKLNALAEQHGLGDKWVIQTAYGDSGKTTFFVENELEYNQFSDQIESEDRVKVMKRIHCQETAIEACVTRCGTVVGPLMTELIGEPQLTPYQGGWCGNTLSSDDFNDELRKKVQDAVIRLGDELARRGYKGYFEVDFLRDLETNEMYLGEMNPRITGITAMTNLSEFSQSTLPLFLFHIIEFMDIDYSFDVEDYNQRSLYNASAQTWSQLIFKHPQDELRLITDAPQSGIWSLDDGVLNYQGMATHRRAVQEENQGFYLRLSKESDYLYKGADLGVLFIPHQLKAVDGRLTDIAQSWVTAISDAYESRELTEEEQLIIARHQNPGQLKAF